MPSEPSDTVDGAGSSTDAAAGVAATMPAAESTLEPAPSTAPAADGSLGVGSLKGENRYE